MKPILGLGLLLIVHVSWADEGMWTLNNLPAGQLQTGYDFDPDPAWVDKVQRASVRLAGGCSGSFVSDQGLILTNNHCVSHCVSQLSTRTDNLVAQGFYAETRADERICPDIEINQLQEIRDVTQRVRAATADLDERAANTARKAVKSAIERECLGDQPQARRCDVVTLYHGGQYHLYRYRRYQDVRLVFAPESSIAFFGGDPDNFNFPRYDLDMSLLRAYEADAPAQVADFFPWQSAGAYEGELVFVTGHPGATQRLLTAAQLAVLRDVILPERMIYLAEFRGLLKQFGAQGAEQARISQSDLFSIENGLKAYRGRHAALVDPEFFATKRATEAALQTSINKKKRWRQAYGDAWQAIERASTIWRDIYTEFSFLEYQRGFASELFGIARQLVRAAAERPKPDGERLREFSEAALPRVTQTLFSAAPIYPELEVVKLAWSLEKLRENLGADHPAVRLVLGQESPAALARRVVQDSRLADVSLRKSLWDGGAAAIAASTDPMIQLAMRVDPLARAIRKRYEDEVESVEERNGEKIAQAVFQVYGTGTYPDATFTLRLSYGTVRGWEERGKPVLPFTTIGGTFARATGAPPYDLPASWLRHEADLDFTTRMNFVTTNDIIGGNSGSPVINRKAELVGLIFDGNIHSLGGGFLYDARYNRAVAVHSAAMLEALRVVYGAQRILNELKHGQ